MISSSAKHFDVVNLWLRLVLHAGVPLCFTTCLKSCRPYGAGLPHPTPSLQRTTPAPLVVMADKDPPSPTPPEDQPLVVTSRHREEERRSDPLWTEENPDKRVYNRSLKDYINIRYLSITETMRHASKKYSSTLALLQLDTILRYAVVYGKPKPPKKGVANQKIFSYMLEMHYELIGIGLVKMMVGVKRTGEKIQYCITAIEA